MGRKDDKRKQCPACKKSITRRTWHYSEGQYFCNSTCSKKVKKDK